MDLAAKNPEKLAELKALFEKDAKHATISIPLSIGRMYLKGGSIKRPYMIIHDIDLLARKIAVGIVIAVVPFLLFFGGLWLYSSPTLNAIQLCLQHQANG